MYHYFGHWHVRMLFFSLFYGLSQSLHVEVQCQEEPKGGERQQGRRGGSGRTSDFQLTCQQGRNLLWIILFTQATHDSYHVVKRLRAKQFTNILLFSRPMPHPLSEITSKNEEEKCLKNREAVRDLIVIDVCISWDDDPFLDSCFWNSSFHHLMSEGIKSPYTQENRARRLRLDR